MKDVICEVCFNEYKPGARVPRLFECGHCCCTSCLKRLLQTSKACMKCRKGLNKRHAEDFQINYSLLEVIETLENRSSSEMDFKKFFRDSLVKMKEIAAQENDPAYTIQTIKESIDEVSSQIGVFDEPAINSRIRLDDIKDDDAFLELIFRALSKNEKLFAVTKVGDVTKTAKLSLSGRRLFIHAFEESDIASYGGSGRSKAILFSDLKKIARINTRAFIVVPRADPKITQTLIVELQDSSRVQEFVRCCTGEVGPSLKGCVYDQGTPKLFVEYKEGTLIPLPFKSVLKVDTLRAMYASSQSYDYVVEEERDLILHKDFIGCKMDAKGNFSILGIASCAVLKNIVGVVEETDHSFASDFYSNISYRDGSMIEDCGIVIQIKPDHCQRLLDEHPNLAEEISQPEAGVNIDYI